MTTNNATIKYALYCRKSTEDSSRQILSLDSQEQEMKKLAKNLGLDISLIFRESKSAKKPNNRPEFSEMIKLIEKEKIEGIICWKIDRLSRNPIDSGNIQWLLQQGKLKVIQTMDRQYLPSDNVLLFNVESGMANQYIRDLSVNVKRGIKAKLEKGYWPNLAPIGYLNEKSQIIIDNTKARYIKKAFEMYASGKYGVREIADILFKEGFKSNAGRKYHKSKIHKMLKKSFYYGIMEKDGEKYLGKYEPIISKKLFDDVQAVFEKKKNNKRNVLSFSFRGLLKCANCGCQLTASKKKGKHIYYYCTNGKGKCLEHKAYLKEEYLSKELSSVFDSLVFDEKLVDLVYRAKLEENQKDNHYLNESVFELQSKLKRLQERKNALLDVFLDNSVSREDYEEKNKNIANEIIETNKDLEEINKKKNSQDKNTLEQIKNLFLQPKIMRNTFLSSNHDKQRDILNSLLWNADIENKKIANISFKQPYDVLSKIDNKSDFNSMRRGGDSNPRYE